MLFVLKRGEFLALPGARGCRPRVRAYAPSGLVAFGLVKLSGLQGIQGLCLLMNFRDVSCFHTGNLFTHAVVLFKFGRV